MLYASSFETLIKFLSYNKIVILECDDLRFTYFTVCSSSLGNKDKILGVTALMTAALCTLL